MPPIIRLKYLFAFFASFLLQVCHEKAVASISLCAAFQLQRYFKETIQPGRDSFSVPSVYGVNGKWKGILAQGSGILNIFQFVVLVFTNLLHPPKANQANIKISFAQFEHGDLLRIVYSSKASAIPPAFFIFLNRISTCHESFGRSCPCSIYVRTAKLFTK